MEFSELNNIISVLISKTRDNLKDVKNLHTFQGNITGRSMK